MTAEKPEGDVASPLRELADAHAVAAFYVRGSSDIRDAIVKQAVRIESQATRIATLSEALERARGCIKGLCARTPVRDVAETLAEIDSALSAIQGDAK